LNDSGLREPKVVAPLSRDLIKNKRRAYETT